MFCSFGRFLQAEVKPGFAQNRIFLLIINEICASTTITDILFFTAVTFYVHPSFHFHKAVVWEDVPVLTIATSL